MQFVLCRHQACANIKFLLYRLMHLPAVFAGNRLPSAPFEWIKEPFVHFLCWCQCFFAKYSRHRVTEFRQFHHKLSSDGKTFNQALCEWSDPNISWFVFSPGPGWHKYYRSWIKLHQLPPQQSRSGLYMKCFSVSQSINLSCLVCFAIFAKNSWPSLCEKCNVLKAVWAESWHLSSSKNSFIESIFLETKIVRGRQITTCCPTLLC